MYSASDIPVLYIFIYLSIYLFGFCEFTHEASHNRDVKP